MKGTRVAVWLAIGLLGLVLVGTATPATAYFDWDLDQTADCVPDNDGAGVWDWAGDADAFAKIWGHAHDIGAEYNARAEVHVGTGSMEDTDEGMWPVKHWAKASADGQDDELWDGYIVWADAEVRATDVLETVQKDPDRARDPCTNKAYGRTLGAAVTLGDVSTGPAP